MPRRRVALPRTRTMPSVHPATFRRSRARAPCARPAASRGLLDQEVGGREGLGLRPVVPSPVSPPLAADQPSEPTGPRVLGLTGWLVDGHAVLHLGPRQYGRAAALAVRPWRCVGRCGQKSSAADRFVDAGLAGGDFVISDRVVVMVQERHPDQRGSFDRRRGHRDRSRMSRMVSPIVSKAAAPKMISTHIGPIA